RSQIDLSPHAGRGGASGTRVATPRSEPYAIALPLLGRGSAPRWLPVSVSPTPRGRGIDLTVDGFHSREGADEGAFLPAAPVGELVAGHVEAALRVAGRLGMCGKSFVALVGPAEAGERHVVPADGDPVLDPIRIARMQPVALFARDVQPLVDRPGVEVIGRRPIHVGAGEHALGGEKAG